MFFIPGVVVALVTFPGVIVHEVAHQLFCRICRVAVFEVCYLRVKNPVGYVIHEPPSTPVHHLYIGIGPFVLNSILGILISFPAAIPVFKFESATPLDYLLIWLGVSIAMHSFPSTGDAKSIWDGIHSPTTPLWVKLIGTPVVGLIYLGAAGSVIWLDLAYGYGIVRLLPELFIKLFA